MDPKKILIADDEPDILEFMGKAVIRAGYQVVTARDGDEAWAKIQSENPDVILLDINMPQKNGFEVLELLRTNPPSDKWQPVIIVSARNELEDMQKGLSMDADHYITKPCQLEDVVQAIKLMISLIPNHKSNTELNKE